MPDRADAEIARYLAEHQYHPRSSKHGVPDPAAKSYRIERSLSGGPFQLLVTLPGAVPSYVDAVSGLTKQNPKYRIISVNASGMSPAVAVP